MSHLAGLSKGLALVMLTGDNRRTAAAVAGQLGIDAVEAEIEPAGKVAHIKKHWAFRWRRGVLFSD